MRVGFAGCSAQPAFVAYSVLLAVILALALLVTVDAMLGYEQ